MSRNILKIERRTIDCRTDIHNN